MSGIHTATVEPKAAPGPEDAQQKDEGRTNYELWIDPVPQSIFEDPEYWERRAEQARRESLMAASVLQYDLAQTLERHAAEFEGFIETANRLRLQRRAWSRKMAQSVDGITPSTVTPFRRSGTQTS